MKVMPAFNLLFMVLYMKKPIVESDIGGSKETVLNEKSGILYKAGDARELAKVLNKLIELDKEALYSMGNEGRKNITKKYNLIV